MARHKVTREKVALKKIRMEGQQQGVCVSPEPPPSLT